ncbi:MAG: SDR family oxidoreductase [Planctomycetales bacterium]|nr:SDR family oxidoreductase [Planctomycetales bacterium]
MPVAVVTGSSSGIGRATAFRLAKDGFDLVLHARHNLCGLQQTAKQIQSDFPGRKVFSITADISDSQACMRLVDASWAWCSGIEVWVNNAGADVLTGRHRKLDFYAKLQMLFNVDVAGTIRLSRLVARKLMDRTSPQLLLQVINMGWDQANLGMEGEAGQLFCASKSAVMAFSQALAMEVGPQIRVNCVAPGWIRTAWSQESSDYWTQRAKEECLLNRWGEPQDVANTIAWLASSEAAFVNGQLIYVNGGRRYTSR